MPAPVPIQIRYDNAGVLGAAAAAAGSGQAWQQQHAMDMQVIMQQIQAKQNAALMQQQSDAQMSQLQQAHDFQMQQTQANQPAPDNFYKMSDTDPSTSMKQMGLQAAKAAGVQGPELAMLEQAAGNKAVNAAYFENIKDETIKRAQTTANKNKSVQEKQSYLDSLGGAVPAEHMAYLKSLAGAEDISLPQFTTKIHEMQQGQAAQAREGDLMKKAVAVEHIRAIDDKINFAQSELAAAQRELNTKHKEAALGGGAAAVPWDKVETTGMMKTSEVLMGLLPGGQAINNLQGQLRSVTKTTQGDSMGLQLRLDIAHKQQEIAAYQKTRDDIISQFGAATAQPAAQIAQVSTPEQAMSLPSGTQFMTPDGRIKVRP